MDSILDLDRKPSRRGGIVRSELSGEILALAVLSQRANLSDQELRRVSHLIRSLSDVLESRGRMRESGEGSRTPELGLIESRTEQISSSG